MQNSHNELLIVLNMIEEKSSENIASNDKIIGYINGYLASCQGFSFFFTHEKLLHSELRIKSFN